MRSRAQFRSLAHRSSRWICLALLCCVAPAINAAKYTPEQVKAAYLLRFIYYVDWPPGISQPQDTAAQQELSLCIINDEAVYAFLADKKPTIKNRIVSSRNILLDASMFAASNVDSSSSQIADFLDGCRVLYFGDLSENLIGILLKQYAAAAKLTVSENARFIDLGGMIEFRRKGASLVFDINVSASLEASLTFRSGLLRTAERLINE